MNQETVILLCLLAFSSTLAVRNPIKVKPCPDALTDPASVDVDPCPSQPCVFHKGATVKTTIKFTPPVTVSNGTLDIFGILGSLKVPFPLPDSDPCKGHNLECPLKAGKEYSLVIRFFIKEIFPSIQLIAQMAFKLPGGKNLFCFQLPAKIAK